MQIRVYKQSDEEAVISLWKVCDLIRPWNDPQKDIRRKLKVQPGMFLVGLIEGRIVASVMGGYDGHRGWIYYLAVAPEHRRKGLGKKIINEVESMLLKAGCPKINLMIRETNTDAVKFYEKLGFKPDPVLSFGKRLEEDE